MPFPRPTSRSFARSPHDWRALGVGVLPILSGAAVPWLLWESVGWIDSSELATAALVCAAAYLWIIFRLGEQEQAARRRLGRRYVPPAPDVALTVCVGLVVCLVAPGVSAYALVDAVGFPRLAGVVRSYEATELAATGATLDSIGRWLGGFPLELAPDGRARLRDPHSGALLSLALTWRAAASGLCIAQDDILPDACVSLDPVSGKLRDSEQGVVGRVTAVGIAPPAAAPPANARRLPSP